MLVNKKKKGDVVTLVLTNGVEVLGRFEEITDEGKMVLRKPSQLFMNPENGELGLTPWCISSEVVGFSDSAIAGEGETQKSIADNYIQATSDIKIPKM